tara:strand:+ start:369 stop:605 length:237 start_codon:yes stop_codon:yes gene_type:complete
MFNINKILKNIDGKFPNEVISKAIQSLVNRGILEQYTDEDGDFSFELTKLGKECAEEIFQNPESLMEFLDEEDEDGTF